MWYIIISDYKAFFLWTDKIIKKCMNVRNTVLTFKVFVRMSCTDLLRKNNLTWKVVIKHNILRRYRSHFCAFSTLPLASSCLPYRVAFTHNCYRINTLCSLWLKPLATQLRERGTTLSSHFQQQPCCPLWFVTAIFFSSRHLVSTYTHTRTLIPYTGTQYSFRYVQYRTYTEGESEILSEAFSRFLSKEKISTFNHFLSL